MRARNIIRRTIWTFIALATLIALFYAEEDWRGARAWQSAQAEYKKAGESLDYARFIPPPIPDSQNLAALPLFAQKPPTEKEPFPPLIALEKALRTDEHLPFPPQPGSWINGQSADLKQIRQSVSAIYAAVFKGASAPESVLAQLEAVYPVVTELRAASITRPYCRFKIDYTILPPLNRSSLVILTDQIKLAKMLALDAMLALDDHQPEVALADLRVVFILSSGAADAPSLVGGLVAMGLKAIAVNVIAQGLTLHAWNDTQLAQLQTTLGRMDFLSACCASLRSATAMEVLNIQYFRNYPFQIIPLLTGTTEHVQKQNPLFQWPAGWMDETTGKLVLLHLGLFNTIDPATHRVYPERVRRQRDALRHGFRSPAHFFIQDIAVQTLAIPFKFARAQTWIDHAILACALERYRLVHGSYPASLDPLCPAYCAETRHDVINGEPYHYRVLPDGGYLLYSVGSNEKDDGGIVVYYKEHYVSPQIDYDQGDWVWFGAK